MINHWDGQYVHGNVHTQTYAGVLRMRAAIVAICVVILCGDAFAQSPKHPKDKAQSRTQTTAPDKRGTDDVPLAIKILPAPDAATKAAEEKKERDEKAATDDRLVQWTHALFWATVALAFVAATQVGFFWWQLLLMRDGVKDAALAASAARDSADAAKASIDLAQKTFMVDQRPWVSVDTSIAGPLAYYPNGNAYVTLRFLLKNVGRSPATHVSVDALIYPVRSNRSDYELEQKRVVEQGRFERPADRSPRFRGGLVLFPGETRTLDRELVIARAEIDEAVAECPPTSRPHFTPVIVGCVSYGFAFASEGHQSGFLIHLTNKFGLPIDLAEVAIPVENMQLHQFFGAYID